MANDNDKNIFEEVADNIQEKGDKIKEAEEIERKTDTLTFDDYVIEKIAAIAARDIPGVLELKGGFFSGITEAFASNTDTNTQGVSVEVDENNVVVDLKAILEYGQSAPRIFTKVKQTIKEKVKEMTGLNVTAVNMKVSDIMTEKEFNQAKADKN
ncbi:MAG: Asp23/Gls24 family envelope stress response protein [Clostridiales bacterium]|nr:Asp23/Gls24 family envelope stress response protein [Clostridiales bacterium]MDY4060400.1 Asp23/Gls24 family envelope stress response protein [Anaerovoracaceae bacterium]